MKYAPNPEGLVETRKARSTGTFVDLYDNRSGQYMSNDYNLENWYTTCVDHGIVLSHRTKADARSWMAEPEGWCAECAAIIANREPDRVSVDGMGSWLDYRRKLVHSKMTARAKPAPA